MGLVLRVRAPYPLAAAWLTAGRTDALFYDVYSKLAELHLAQVGLDVAWSEVRVGSGDEEDRWGATRKYFTVPWYRLPVCVMGVME
jgi:protein arginine N-methyltransferase 2